MNIHQRINCLSVEKCLSFAPSFALKDMHGAKKYDYSYYIFCGSRPFTWAGGRLQRGGKRHSQYEQPA